MPLLDAPFGFRANRLQLLMPDPFPVTPEMLLHQAVLLDPLDAVWLMLKETSEIVVGI